MWVNKIKQGSAVNDSIHIWPLNVNCASELCTIPHPAKGGCGMPKKCEDSLCTMAAPAVLILPFVPGDG